MTFDDMAALYNRFGVEGRTDWSPSDVNRVPCLESGDGMRHFKDRATKFARVLSKCRPPASGPATQAYLRYMRQMESPPSPFLDAALAENDMSGEAEGDSSPR